MGQAKRLGSTRFRLYKELLDYIRSSYSGEYWAALPRQVAAYLLESTALAQNQAHIEFEKSVALSAIICIMDITVFGMGYVGCVTAGCLADMGHSVTGVDLQETKVSLINAGKSPVIEPALGDVILRGVEAGRLHATHRVQRVGGHSLICVGTPGHDNGSWILRRWKELSARSANYYEKKTAFTSWSFGAPFCLGRWTMSCGHYWKKVRQKGGKGLRDLHESRVHAGKHRYP